MSGTRALSADRRRALLLDLYARACAAVDGRRAVRAALAGTDGVGEWSILAIGKAASGMALGALDLLGGRVGRGLVISRRGHLDPELGRWPMLTCLEGDHPVPGAASLAAGAAVLAFAAATPARGPILVLVSGGASSLVEALPAGVDSSELARANEWGIANGLAIGELNAVRRRLSRLKDGRLAAALAHADARALLMSDVPGDDPAVIGSGLVRASGATPLPAGLPDWLAALAARAAAELPAGGAMPATVVAGIEDCFIALERAADARGLVARRLVPLAAGDVLQAASRYAHALAVNTADLLVWGGETSVQLPPDPGRGGRNQAFALATARLIAGHTDLVVLAAGTDGTDGNSDDAGAIVDGGTLERGRVAGLDANAALAAADSGPFLQATGDLLYTGPTGINVGDLVIGLRAPPDAPAALDPADRD